MKRILCFVIGLLLTHVCLAKPTSLRLMLDWYQNPDHAPIFVAQHQGFFKKNGLNVTIITPSDPSDPVKLVATNKIDIGVTYQTSAILAKQQQLPIQVIGSLIDQPLAAIAILANNPIDTIADLKGKKIGYSNDAADRILIAGILAHAGLKLTDVSLINVHYNLVQALLSKQVDAVSGIMRNVETIELQQLGYPVKLFYPENNGIPPYHELIYITHKNHLNSAMIKKFSKSMQQATRYLQKYPDAMWQAFAKTYPELNNSVNKQSWFATLPYFSKDSRNINKQEFENYAMFVDEYAK